MNVYFHRIKLQQTLIVLAIFGLFLANTRAEPVVISVHKESDGITLREQAGILKLRVFGPRIIEVIYAQGYVLPRTKSFSVIDEPHRTKWKLDQSKDEIVVRTDELAIHINRTTGAIAIFDSAGDSVLSEAGVRSLTPTQANDKGTWCSDQEFSITPDEAFFGLGQHGSGLMNYRGTIVHLEQRNPTESAVPFLVSSRGYGILWDNPAITDVDAGKSNSNILSLKSESAETIDYYFVYGPELDEVIRGYRQLTGEVPMFGKWAWGFWQSKEHYATQEELLDVVKRYRQMGVPLDGIIQDWYYWNPHPWGSHEFDTNRYPDFAKLMEELHADHMHLIISVWGRFDIGSTNWQELEQAKALYPEVYDHYLVAGRFQYYDAFNPAARRIYWDQISKELSADGIDGWWLDASEPELNANWGEFGKYTTAAGAGSAVYNAYPLMHTMGIYQGQRAETPAKRVFILTRSAYAGQQRNAAVTWSGDITANWDTFDRQIPAGLNFAISGIPYWNTDIGGFFGNNPGDPKFVELFTRWFQFGAFCPMFRVHGTTNPKEMWRFDEATQKILIEYDKLRYHLLPYIYSTSWMVTHDGYTMMRPLVMDFQSDTNVFNIPDQFMFGPALMACPVTGAGEMNRSVYLPAGPEWYDFWTGEKLSGGQHVTAASPTETMPLYVRAGSIIPYGPEIQYATQSSDPIELRVYRGANGHFTLYEDENDNYDYEKGIYATIPFDWNEIKQTLTIGKRKGKFPTMIKDRTFHIVWVSPKHGAGISNEEKPDIIVRYTGSAVTVSAKDE
ncbi:MAG TPA: glycoside hydrolase family 31 protein [Pseudomonadales bacterium]|nr:glycoside hydrolase family 31 protein [Pseudomonadales bacterium]